MEKTFWNTLTKRRMLKWPRRHLVLLTTVFVAILAPLAFAPQAQAFPIVGGLIRGLLGGFGGLLSRLGIGGLLLLFGGSVHDHAREKLQMEIHAQEQVKLAYLDKALVEMEGILGDAQVWDSLRVAWFDEYRRQLEKAPSFAYAPAPDQQRQFEASLTGRNRALLRFMDDPGSTQALWTASDPHYQATQGDPLPVLAGAAEAALGAQTGTIALLDAQHQAVDGDADELTRFIARIDSLSTVMQMRDVKAQGLLLQIKQLQQVRYGLVQEAARRAAVYGEDLNAEARRRALYERLLLPAAGEPIN